MKHRRAFITIGIATGLDLIGGIVFSISEHLHIGYGLYWALATATTVGYGDITPRTTVGHLISAGVMLTVVPLFAATFSLITSGLTAEHVHIEGSQARQRLDHIIQNHPSIPEFQFERDRL